MHSEVATEPFNMKDKVAISDPAKLQATQQTNVMGVYLCMKYEIQQTIEDGGGSVVNLGSIGGLSGIPYTGPYSATNAVAPGPVNTDIITGSIAVGQYDEATISAMTPMARMGNTEEIAYGIAWMFARFSHKAVNLKEKTL